jgi:hypothetical protein
MDKSAPLMASWGHKARRLAQADWPRRLEAGGWLALMRAGLWCLPFAWMVRLVGLRPGEPLDTGPYSAPAQAAAIGAAVAALAAHTPWPSTCLVQALAAAAMLRRRGLCGVLYLGVQRAPPRAHAWLRHGDQILTGQHGHAEFAVIATYVLPSSRT